VQVLLDICNALFKILIGFREKVLRRSTLPVISSRYKKREVILNIPERVKTLD
jgi:hypothetical protein